MIHRRSFITGLISLVAAPAIVRAGSLMPVKVIGPTMIEFHLPDFKVYEVPFPEEFKLRLDGAHTMAWWEKTWFERPNPHFQQ